MTSMTLEGNVLRQKSLKSNKTFRAIFGYEI